MADFNKVGLLVIRNRSFLVCRKRDFTSKLIMPGGQVEPGESVEECLQREIREELGAVSLGPTTYVGTYEDIAAADDPAVRKTVEIKLYQAALVGEPTPSSEIKELLWFNSASDKNDLSSIIAKKILPDLLGRGILAW